jgi:hypothetical protein
MELSEDDLKTLWQRETTRPPGGRADCLSTELLARAGAGELTANERARVAGHLSHCADCAVDYRLALAVGKWATQAAAFPARAIAPARRLSWWQRLTAFDPLAVALAAALLIISVALGAWLLSIRQQNRALVAQLNRQRSEAAENIALRDRIEELQRRQTELSAPPPAGPSDGQETLRAENEKLKDELARLSRPQLDVPQFDLDSNSATRGPTNGREAQTLQIPASASTFTINLPGAGRKPYPVYLIELRNARTNRVIWGGRRRQSNETTITLTLTRRTLPAGKYRIEVSGIDGKQRELIETYEIQVSGQP